MTSPDLKVHSARILVIGDGGSPLARRLRAQGHRVTELLASDFHGQEEMADVVAVLPDCPEPERVGAVAAACARCVWFQERPAPAGLARILAAAGVRMVAGRDLGEEGDA
jgi:hypothetical protein